MHPALHRQTVFSRDDEAIIAHSSPRGSGAIALIRMSGSNALTIADNLCTLSNSKKVSEQPSHTVAHGFVVNDQGAHVDEVMVTILHAPRTFTGQNTVEISCHNNQLIIDTIIARAAALGARQAEHGEFSRRAVINGKLSLIQAEAVNEIIHATTEAALKQALAQREGSLSKALASIEQMLISTLAWCEASFEFLEEGGDFADTLREKITTIRARLVLLGAHHSTQAQLRSGFSIALIGSVNAGKSSLFNKLVGHSRAIVTDLPGTTRDSIEASVMRNGTFWTLIDTAGLRVTHDIVEKEGILRSRQAAAKADVVIIALDGSRNLTAEERAAYNELVNEFGQRAVLVATKSDLAQVHHENTIPISSTTGYGIDVLWHALDAQVAKISVAGSSPFLLSNRQIMLIQRLDHDLAEILGMLTRAPAYELISIHLRDAIERLAQLTGKTVSEAAFDAVFREFCVGK